VPLNQQKESIVADWPEGDWIGVATRRNNIWPGCLERIHTGAFDTHATTTELVDNPVVGDGLTDWRLGIRHLGRY